MVWLYLPEVEDLNSDSPLRSEHITKQSPTLKGSVRPLRSWLRTWNAGGWIRLLSGMTLQPSQAMSLAHSWITSTLSQRDSLASRGQSQAVKKEPMTSDGSGLSYSDWFARYDPEASSWRTSQVSFMEELNTFSETWPRSGSMRNGQVFEHQTLARPTVGSGFLSWPTADTNDRNPKPENHRTDTNFDPKTGTGRHSISLGQVAANWATPTASDGKQGDIENQNTKYVTTKTGRLRKLSNSGKLFNIGLAREARRWATPRANDSEKRGDISNDPRHGLPAIAQHWATPEARDWKGHTITENHPKGYNHALPNDVAMWMTPAVMSANDKFKNMPTDLSRLSSQGVAWSTPLASDDGHKVTVNSGQTGLIGDADRFIGHPLQTALIGKKSLKQDPTLPRLNPQFVEWLMGWPEGWLDPINSESSETE